MIDRIDVQIPAEPAVTLAGGSTGLKVLVRIRL